jgi:hypothetical protein
MPHHCARWGLGAACAGGAGSFCQHAALAAVADGAAAADTWVPRLRVAKHAAGTPRRHAQASHEEECGGGCGRRVAVAPSCRARGVVQQETRRSGGNAQGAGAGVSGEGPGAGGGEGPRPAAQARRCEAQGLRERSSGAHRRERASSWEGVSRITRLWGLTNGRCSACRLMASGSAPGSQLVFSSSCAHSNQYKVPADGPSLMDTKEACTRRCDARSDACAKAERGRVA